MTGTETPFVVPTVERHAAFVVWVDQAATVLLISQDARDYLCSFILLDLTALDVLADLADKTALRL